MKKSTIKKYLISSFVTFVAVFCATVLPMINDITIETLKQGALISVVFAGVRAGVKAIFELIVDWYSSRK